MTNPWRRWQEIREKRKHRQLTPEEEQEGEEARHKLRRQVQRDLDDLEKRGHPRGHT